MKRTLPWVILSAVLVALIPLPWYGSATFIQFGINALLLATLAQSWNIIGGYCGYASFGNSVFYGLGSYGTGIAMAQFGLPFGVGLAAGAALGIVFAVVLGMPLLRLRGHYFAIATLASSEVMNAIVTNLDIAGRNIGLVLPLFRGDALFFELALGLVAAATLAVFWISRSRFGFGLIAIRENEEAAAVMGINTTLYKVLAFSLAAFFAALAGGIHAYWITFVDPASSFDITLNVKMIIMAIFGGAGSVLGPVIGAFVLSGISEILATKISTVASLFFGLVIVGAVIFMPHGTTNLVRRLPREGWRYFVRNVRATRL
jgi:branched-chain amino acid transport system permease protein